MIHRILIFAWCPIAVTLLASAQVADQVDSAQVADATNPPIDFAHQVVPILRQHCAECHAGGEAKGGFSINTRELFLEGGAAIPGNANDSLFLELARSADTDSQMPPKEFPRVGPQQQKVLADWIDAGMPWTAGFSFSASSYEPPLRPRDIVLPGPSDANPIDQIIGNYLHENDRPPLEPIDDAAFLRRASLDLIGLLPTPQHFRTYQSDRSPDKREVLIDTLLAQDTAYAEHWLTFFNDLLRNDYAGTGFITGGRKQISGWLYRSLIENKPFNQFTRELVAPSNEASRGFIEGIKWRGTVSAGQTNEIQFAQSVAQSFLGINLKCASCHDSFIDRWKLKDAYALAAVYSERPLEIHRCDQPTGDVAEPGWLFPELGQVEAEGSRDDRLTQLAALITTPDNGRFARTIVNRLWAQMMGRGIVHPLDAMHTQPWNEALLDHLANHLVANHYDLKAVLRLIATSDVYNAMAAQVHDDPNLQAGYVFAGRIPIRMTAEQFLDSVWQLTGSAPAEFDAPVMRGKIDADAASSIQLHGQWIWGDSAADGKVPKAGDRILFRKKITLPAEVVAGSVVVSADNEFDLYIARRKVSSSADWTKPQTVAMVGRLVKGDNEFVVDARNAGDRPNAAGFYLEGRLKLSDGTLIEITSDDSWRQSDQPPIGGREGRLGRTPGPWKPVTLQGHHRVYAKIKPLIKRGLAMGLANETSMVRASLLKSDFLMRSLGRPNRDQIVTSRPSDLTTLEAIDLANGGSLADALAKGAQNYLDRQLTTDQLIDEVYHFALSRDPSAKERATLVSALGPRPSRQTIEDFLWVICMMPEFMLVG